MLIRILIIGGLAIGLMAAIKDGRVLREAGLLGSCTPVVVNGKPDATLQSCSKGRLDGFPDLTNRSCHVVSFGKQREVWRCEAPLIASQTPNGG